MEDKKNRGWLSERWWYRLLKIIFIVLFSITVASAVLLLLGSQGGVRRLNAASSIATCDTGSIFSFQSAGANSELSPGSYSDELIKKLCIHKDKYYNIQTTDSPSEMGSKLRGMSLDIMFRDDNANDMRRRIEFMTNLRNNNDFQLGSQLLNQTKYKTALVYDSLWLSFLGTLSIWITAIALFFEAIRRMFFYVVIGRFWVLRDKPVNN